MGGVAVGLCCPSAQSPPLARPYRDIDFAGRSDQGRAITALFQSAGYEADAEFNALHGRHRMFFWDPGNGREADVFLDRFAMCHSFDFRKRLELASPTLPVADLLLFKLQVIETNDKDYQDAIALLADQPLTPDGLDPAGIARFLATDWGWWRTVTRVLERVESYAQDLPGFDHGARVIANIAALRAAIDGRAQVDSLEGAGRASARRSAGTRRPRTPTRPGRSTERRADRRALRGSPKLGERGSSADRRTRHRYAAPAAVGAWPPATAGARPMVAALSRIAARAPLTRSARQLNCG